MPTRFRECGPAFSGELGLQVVPRVMLEQAAITATATAASSAAISSPTCRLVCVQSDEQIYVKVGSAPTATTNSYRIPAGGEQYFEAGVGDSISIRT